MSDDKADSRRRAVALAYSGERLDAPRVVAKGYGSVAERMIELARQEEVFVHDSPELVSLLMQIDLDERIPAELYQVIAELLVWIGELDRQRDDR
ncbi:EscU/YscU/HrcU family type III secretion system export apparatus switch protein [Salinicola rhizosphaerae]|uniref:Flagellar biosynthetic protein FlhB n=1 Tax=Salinicola rhizosphaerae TaxID=1443141 RepID=A0ABQ3DQ96_9GAMM|nr:EscU/YscU/HrcU family type III secretion system export apparatus switch protein [Salinicola rhizosphaerae]GHB10271.1 export system protein [Salinicola rhizosphaerae]